MQEADARGSCLAAAARAARRAGKRRRSQRGEENRINQGWRGGRQGELWLGDEDESWLDLGGIEATVLWSVIYFVSSLLMGRGRQVADGMWNFDMGL